MAEDKLGRNQLDKLLANHPALELQATFALEGRTHIGRLRLDFRQGSANDPDRLRRKVAHYGSLQGLAAAFASITAAFALDSGSTVMWAITATFISSYIGLTVFRERLRRRARSLRGLRQKYDTWEFAHPVQRSWRVAAESDETIAWLVTQWMLTALEIEQLEQRIREGVVARKHLSPIDPLRAQMQVEIDTLRSRRDDLRASAQIESQRISEHSQEHSDEKKREALKQQRLTAIAESEAARARDLDEKIRAAEQAEQERLAKQERAQKWLYDDPDR